MCASPPIMMRSLQWQTDPLLSPRLGLLEYQSKRNVILALIQADQAREAKICQVHLCYLCSMLSQMADTSMVQEIVSIFGGGGYYFAHVGDLTHSILSQAMHHLPHKEPQVRLDVCCAVCW